MSLSKRNIPPVTKEFIAEMKKAFTNKRPKVNATLGEIQRQQGQLDVIEWASNFVRQYDPFGRTQ